MSRYIFTTMLCSAITMSFGQNKIKQYNVIYADPQKSYNFLLKFKIGLKTLN
jgi:hypothetical protein